MPASRAVDDIVHAIAGLEPEEIGQLCGDPVFRTVCKYCMSQERTPRLDFGRPDTFDPLQDHLDDPLPEEGDYY